jgi:NADPH:quinone reductase-like Zn-dependent oxidoreductase
MSSAALTFDKHGEPADVLQLTQQDLPELGGSDVHLKMLAVSKEYSN